MLFRFSSCISTAASPFPRTTGFPWLLLLTSSAVIRCRPFHASHLCHLFMNRPAASTIPLYQFSFFLAALSHSTVPTLNSKGELSVDPSDASNIVMTSTRHSGHMFVPGCPRPGFNAPSIVANITLWASRSVLMCTALAKSRRRLPIAVSTLSRCYFLRPFAYDMRWSVRCRP